MEVLFHCHLRKHFGTLNLPNLDYSQVNVVKYAIQRPLFSWHSPVTGTKATIIYNLIKKNGGQVLITKNVTAQK